MTIKKKYLILIIILIIVLCLSILYFWVHKKSKNIQLSGRLEGYETDIGPKVGGRIDYVVAREGTAVHKGELIVKLDDSDIQARLKAANANIEVSKQQEQQAKLQLSVIKNQIMQGKLSFGQSKDESLGSVGQAKASVSIAEAQLLQAQEQLKQADSDLELATIDYKRYTNLLKNCAIPKRTYDNAKTKYDVALSNQQLRREAMDVSKSQIEQAKSLLIQANSTKYNPYIKNEQISLLEIQLMQGKSQLEAAKSNVLRYDAERQEILAQIAYLNVLSPIDGIIIARTVEPGEIVNAGKTLLTLLNLNTVYMRGYIPEGQMGFIKVGQKAKVYLDSAPKEPLEAWVSQIDSEASFTPENIYFRDDRVKQVFGLKLNIVNPNGFAKPGMPADAEILLQTKKEKL